MNIVVLTGRLTKDPEIRYMPQTQSPVASFTLAVDRPMSKDKSADFIRVVAFDKNAEFCEKYLTKGKPIGVQGRIHTGSYKTQSGETRYTTEVYADRFEFLGDKGTSETRERQPMPASMVPDGFQALDDDDDIPF